MLQPMLQMVRLAGYEDALGNGQQQWQQCSQYRFYFDNCPCMFASSQTAGLHALQPFGLTFIQDPSRIPCMTLHLMCREAHIQCVKAAVVVMQCSDKPSDPDKYGFSNFARMLMSGKGLNPLPSDSRRRPDRAALQVCPSHVLLSSHRLHCCFGA